MYIHTYIWFNSIHIVYIRSIIVKALPQVMYGKYNMGACQDINTAQGVAECCIYLEAPRVLYFSYMTKNCYIVHISCQIGAEQQIMLRD